MILCTLRSTLFPTDAFNDLIPSFLLCKGDIDFDDFAFGSRNRSVFS